MITTRTDYERIAGLRCGCPCHPPELIDKGVGCLRDCCQGTGKRFPWMWRECWCYPLTENTRGQHGDCTGRVLIEHDRTDALLRVALARNGSVDIDQGPKGFSVAILESAIKKVRGDVKDSVLEALASACWKALNNEGKA